MSVEVLKENIYKRVELIQQSGSPPYVVKKFFGHANEDCLRNAEHTYQSLNLLRKRFAHVLRSPVPLNLDVVEYSVQMEYLADLPRARIMRLKDAYLASRFFEICYEIDDDLEFLGSIGSSVHLTKKTKALIDSGCPMRLGFKGDLYENLRLGNSGLILADSETASLEPLGLSELILYVFLAASPDAVRRLTDYEARSLRPVAFNHLPVRKSEEMIEAALESASVSMGHLLAPLRAAKLFLARRLLLKLLRIQ